MSAWDEQNFRFVENIGIFPQKEVDFFPCLPCLDFFAAYELLDVKRILLLWLKTIFIDRVAIKMSKEKLVPKWMNSLSMLRLLQQNWGISGLVRRTKDLKLNIYEY